MLTGKHAARASEAGQHFISNHERAVAVTQPSHASKKFSWPDDHAARALQHRFDQHARDCPALFAQQALQIIQAINAARSTLQTERAAIAVWRMSARDTKKQRRERLRKK